MWQDMHDRANTLKADTLHKAQFRELLTYSDSVAALDMSCLHSTIIVSQQFADVQLC